MRRESELLTALADCGIEQYTRTMQGLQCAVTEEKNVDYRDRCGAARHRGKACWTSPAALPPAAQRRPPGRSVCRGRCKFKYAARTPTPAS
ncbi:hypothetical protein [Gemmiger formicilis]|uniref:hypothetical protein n=1 Tax=Gemmiger formicilis TaxID=745368 RepID=UPI00351FD9C3